MGFAQHAFVFHLLSVQVLDIAVEDDARHIVGVLNAVVNEIGLQLRAAPKAPVVAHPHAQREVYRRRTLRAYIGLVLGAEHGVELPYAVGKVCGNINLWHGINDSRGVGLLSEGDHREQDQEHKKYLGFHGSMMIKRLGAIGGISGAGRPLPRVWGLRRMRTSS